MAGRAEAGINHDRHGGLLDDDANLIACLKAAIRANRRAEWHHRGGADVLQTFGQYRVGIDVRQHNKAFLHELIRGFERFDRVGQQVTRVRMDLQLHPVRQSGSARQSRESHGFLGVHCAAGVGQDQITLRINEIQNVREGIMFAAQVRAAERDGDHFRAAGVERVPHFFR